METKKYKISFSIYNLFGDSCAQVVMLQNKFKAGLTALAGLTYVYSNAELTLIVAIAGAIVDSLLSCFNFEETK